MKDIELAKNIITFMESVNRPVKWNEIAAHSGLTSEFWQVSAVLTRLQVAGKIEQIKGDFATTEYKIVAPAQSNDQEQIRFIQAQIEKFYKGTITLEKKITGSLYFTILSPLQAKTNIRVDLVNGCIYENGHGMGMQYTGICVKLVKE